MTRIASSPGGFGFGAVHPHGLDRLDAGSAYASNEEQRNRQAQRLFLEVFRKCRQHVALIRLVALMTHRSIAEDDAAIMNRTGAWIPGRYQFYPATDKQLQPAPV
jgi:hypothetical protein